MVGFWATLSVNVCDYTRFCASQKEQIWGQVMGLVPSTSGFAFVGIAVTSASYVIYGEAVWNPIDLFVRMDSVALTVVVMLVFALATLTTNIAANVVAPANDFCNLAPDYINYQTAGCLTLLLGLLIRPWHLLADPNNFVVRWLVASSFLMAGVCGVMLADYYFIRGTELQVAHLYRPKQHSMYYYYHGHNLRAWTAFVVAVSPCLPGMFAELDPTIRVPIVFKWLYELSWFVAVALSVGTYLVLMKVFPVQYTFFELPSDHKEQAAGEGLKTEQSEMVRVDSLHSRVVSRQELVEIQEATDHHIGGVGAEDHGENNGQEEMASQDNKQEPPLLQIEHEQKQEDEVVGDEDEGEGDEGEEEDHEALHQIAHDIEVCVQDVHVREQQMAHRDKKKEKKKVKQAEHGHVEYHSL
eukprot:TRINITY_DN5706_c0_g1_i2.p1 TRINITY_DN5706_c0_g1~~TRINITY_DN5706_c0_g1_i2.p1  ORF type:complete len:412 (+),score=87.22 TRINITY_DN5706_c0_g1_i2:52-1287(+)